MKKTNILLLISVFLGGIVTVFFIIFSIIFNVQGTEQVISPLNITPRRVEDDNKITEFAYVENINNPESTELKLEVARTIEEKSTGLMNRTELGESNGMIFVYENPEEVTFWMMNTFIPLDIIFIDENYKIIKIYENTIPDQTEERYPSTSEIKYVIEVNGGWTDQNNYSVGDLLKVDFSK